MARNWVKHYGGFAGRYLCGRLAWLGFWTFIAAQVTCKNCLKIMKVNR